MNRNIASLSRPLQQQPQRSVNQQQQQSSGSGEFQPRRVRPEGALHKLLSSENRPQQG